MAILSYDLDEVEVVFGQNLTARYHETDTWMRRGGNWQIVAAQVLRYYEDPAPGKADISKFAGYVGTYQLHRKEPSLSLRKMAICIRSATDARKKSWFRKPATYSSAKAWRVERCLAMAMTARSHR